MSMPTWMAKYPCEACGTGYGNCSQGAIHSLKCCKDCKHESPRTWTDDELLEMWHGRDDAPARVLELRRTRSDTPGGIGRP